jgi:CheY-like chemotaxis protein
MSRFSFQRTFQTPPGFPAKNSRGNRSPESSTPKMQSPTVESIRTQPVESSPLLEARVVAQFRYRVLVVDDEPSIRETTKPLLESQGYEALTAADGMDGLLALSKSLPDVIISDLHMPRMSGFEFLTIVRRRFPRIAIIAMSGEFVLGQHLAVIHADAFWQKGQPIKNFSRKSRGLSRRTLLALKERRVTSYRCWCRETVRGISNSPAQTVCVPTNLKRPA